MNKQYTYICNICEDLISLLYKEFLQMRKEMPNKLLGKQAKNIQAVWSQDTKPLINVGNLTFYETHTQRDIIFYPTNGQRFKSLITWENSYPYTQMVI